MKFHMSEDGPKPCSASKKACPVGGEHGTEKEIQESYNKKMEAEHSIPKMTRAELDAASERKGGRSMALERESHSEGTESSSAFDDGVFYDDGNQVKILNALKEFKDMNIDERGTGIEIEEGDYPYETTAFYNQQAGFIEADDKVELGFNTDDNIRPFVSMSSKRNIVWLTPGVEVNGAKKFSNTYRYEVENGEDLKKVFDISQMQVEETIFQPLESGDEIASGLTDTEPDDAIHVGDVRDINVRLM